jgi:hypothetical protein
MSGTARSQPELHGDHLEWWGTLCSWQQELDGFSHRLGEVMANGPARDVQAEVEQFQNRFIREREVIDGLQHTVKTHERSLEKKALETPHVAASAPYRDHAELRERMDTAERLHTALRGEFMHWLADRRRTAP